MNKGLLGKAKIPIALLSIALAAIFVMTFVLPALADSGSALLWTTDVNGVDKTDFAPGDIVYIHGTGFNPESQIDISITRPDLNLEECNSVTCHLRFLDGLQTSDPEGDFVYRYNLNGITGEYNVHVSDAQGVYADIMFTDSRTIDSAKLNDANSVTVPPSTSITAKVTVTTTGSGTDNDWKSTRYRIEGGSWTCVNTPDHTSSGTNTESFQITAPSSAGVYDVNFRAYSDNSCSSGESSTYTLTDGITVTSPAVCNNGVVEPPEVCDDSNNNNCDGCKGDCSRLDNVCGDGIIECGEGCDDHNTNSNDGCSSTCQIENGWSCTGQPSVCKTINPTLPSSCGIDMVLIIDSSGSISNSELTQMKDAFKAFVDAFLPYTPTQIAVVDFDSLGHLVQDYTSNVNDIKTAIDSAISGGNTNWEDGLKEAHDEFNNRADKPDLYVFASDGNPNTIGDTSPSSVTESVAVAAAVAKANIIKLAGVRIITLGIAIGTGGAANLKAISSDDAYYDTDFSTLAQTLAALADDLCGGTVTVRKFVDNVKAPGWHFDLTGASSTSLPADGNTDSEGYVVFDVVIPDTSVTVDVTETSQQGFGFVSAHCYKDNVEVGTPGTETVTGINVGKTDAIYCEFRNTGRECETNNDCDKLDRDYCEGDLIKHVEGECVNYICVETTPITVYDCNLDNQDYCEGTLIKHDDYTCSQPPAHCVLDQTTTLQDCNDGKYCDGQETCLNANCVAGANVVCSKNDLCGIATCDNIPDDYYPTWDYRQAFTSQCIEDGNNQGHCTTGDPTIAHTCSVDDCQAECDATHPCDNKCLDGVWNYNGDCLGDCTCDYDTENCNQYDGWYCTDTSREHRDYHCDVSGCDYTVTSTESCVDADPCTVDACVGKPGYATCSNVFSDIVGPATSGTAVDPPFNNGNFDATSYTQDDCSNIKKSEYFLGHSSVGFCGIPGSGTPMDATDGLFDEKAEDLKKDNVMYNVFDGLNWICVQSQDTANNWGNCDCAYFDTDTIPPDCPYDIYLNNTLYPKEYLICGNNAWLNATVCDEQSQIQGGEYFLDKTIPPVPAPWSGIWMNVLSTFIRPTDGHNCAIIGAFVDTSNLLDGTHYIKLRGKDVVENWGKIIQCQNVSFIKDTKPPITTKTLLPAEKKTHACESGEEDGLPANATLSEGCYYVKAGTQITLNAQDQDTTDHEYADNVRIHWKVWYKVNAVDPWTLDQQGVGAINQSVTITLNKDSYHLIEYWAVDLCGWEETHHYELDIVDTKPPTIVKSIVGPSYGDCLPKDMEDDCYIDGVTTIHVVSTDQEPHPVDHVLCDWDYTVTDGTKTGSGQVGVTPPFDINFPEESTHILTITCRDALGNEVVDVEKFLVDKTAPTTTKTYSTPRYPDDMYHPKWINSSTLITLTIDDTGPHKSGIKETKYRVTLLGSNEPCESDSICQQQTGSGSWITYTGTPFTIGQESCHLIEYYSKDNVDKTETVKKQCVYVDNKPPVITKVEGEPKIPCDVEDPTGCDYWVRDHVTPIDLYCSDQQPHPVDQVHLWYRILLDDEVIQDWTDPVAPEAYKQIIFDEDSVHTLEYYCVDALGNSDGTRDNPHQQVYRVDSVPPETTKTYGEPIVTTNGGYPKWINSSTPITLTAVDGGEICAVGTDKVWYKNILAGSDELCLHPELCVVPEGFKYCQNCVGGEYPKECIDNVQEDCEDYQNHACDYAGTPCSSWEQCVQFKSNQQCCGGWDWTLYTGPFQKQEESCHILYYFGVDSLGNVEDIKVNCFFVDNTPPEIVKSVSEPKHECTKGEWEQYGEPDYGCWYITQQTTITLNCTDVLPHPVNDVTLYYRDYLMDDEAPQYTAVPGGYVEIQKTEDSEHILEFYCEDALRNTDGVHKEIDIVDTQPPEGTKTVGDPKIPCEPEIDGEDGEQFLLMIAEVNPCDSATQPSQCAYLDTTSLPNFVKDTIEIQGGTLDNPGCDKILVLSSGNPADTDNYLSTSMGNPGCGVNPDGYGTYDCVILNSYQPSADSLALAISSEWPEYYQTTFTDWMQIGGSVDMSINSWPSLSSLQLMPAYGPSSAGSVALATLAASQSTSLKVADSGDSIYDTAIIVVPLACFNEPPKPELCGNGKIDPGEECDDGNTNNGDGCSAVCLNEGPQPECDFDYWVRDHATEITLDCNDPEPHPVDHETMCYRISFDSEVTPWLTSDYCEQFGGDMEKDWCCADVSGEAKYKFTFMEDSLHDLEYYCVDALGNQNQADVEYFKVDSTPPETTKTYGEPLVTTNGGYPKWINSSTPITLTAVDGGEICAVDDVTTYWRNLWIPGGEAAYQVCGDPKEYCNPQTYMQYVVNPEEPWNVYKGPFYKNEESCHIIEYYSEDALGNKEDVKWQCVFVDNTPPEGTKIVGKPNIPCGLIVDECDGSCLEQILDGEPVCDYWVRDHVTEITLDCNDPEPHPVDHETMCYRISFDGEPEWLTSDYCDEFGGTMEGDWCCDSGEGLPYTFTFQEDSLHDLEYYCVDALGNANQVDVEYFKVDSTPPESEKTIGDPKWWDEDLELWWVTSDTQFTITAIDKEEPCAVGVDKFHVKIEWDSDCNGEVDTVVFDDYVEEPYQYTFNFGEECLHKITWYAVDMLGNEELEHVQYHKVDNTPPEIFIIKPVDGWYSFGDPIQIVAFAEDLTNKESPCKNEECSVGIEDGAYCYAYLVGTIPFQILPLDNTNLKYNETTKQCQGFAILNTTTIPKGDVGFLVVTVGDRLGNADGQLEDVIDAYNSMNIFDFVKYMNDNYPPIGIEDLSMGEYDFSRWLYPTWDYFFLPQLVLDDIYGSVTHYPETVLASLNKTETPSYDVVWYYNGTQWLSYAPSMPPILNTLKEFNDQISNPYWIKMFNKDLLGIPYP